jgi:ankyrin repeat protein
VIFVQRPPYQRKTLLQVRVLVDAGADPNHSNLAGHIVLSAAAHNGHVGAVRALLAASADLHGSDRDGHTALYVAARQGHVQAVRALLEAGAPLDRRSRLGRSALDVACEVRAVLSCGAWLR